MRPAFFLAMMSSAWSPTDLGAKLKAWWAPLAGSNYTLNGSGVASWSDTVGGYVLAQATASSQPAYSATGWTGGLACAVFDGSNDSLALDGVPAGIPTGSTPSEIWAQARLDATVGDAATRVLFDLGGTASGDPDRRGLSRQPDNSATLTYDGLSGSSRPTNTVAPQGDHVWRGAFGSTSAHLDMDGTPGAVVTGITPTTGTGRIRLGASTFSTSQGPWLGAVRQVVITDALTTGEAAQLLAYLNGTL